MDRDIVSDFSHLSRSITIYNDPIPYELLVILENCLSSPSYKQAAQENLIILAIKEDKIMEGLRNILKNKTGELSHIHAITKQILNEAAFQKAKIK